MCAIGGLYLPVSYHRFSLAGLWGARVNELALPHMEMGDKKSPLSLLFLAWSCTAFMPARGLQARSAQINTKTKRQMHIHFCAHVRAQCARHSQPAAVSGVAQARANPPNKTGAFARVICHQHLRKELSFLARV